MTWPSKPPASAPPGKVARWGILIVGGVLTLLVLVVVSVTLGLPDTREIRALADGGRVTTIFDAHDTPLFPVYKEERVEVPLGRISPDLVRAVLAVEDEHFYHHAGFDIPRIVAAVASDVRRGDRAQGGSTITQQLARKMFLNDNKTVWRKWRELALAVRIEHQFSKDKILELYLNHVYFGHGYYGVEAAARGYFGTHASDVSMDQAALLAGLIQAPSAYAPQAHPDRARARRKVVFSRLVDVGAMDRATADRLAATPIQLHEEAPAAQESGRYFKNYVTRQLVQRFGEAQVFDGGLRVYATIDPTVQQAAERALADGLARIEKLPNYKHPRLDAGVRPAGTTVRGQHGAEATSYLQGAVVALDPTNGFIRALVGGRDFDDSSYDRATQAQRQSGSAFKPFIYAAALEAGYTAATLLTDLDVSAVPGTAWMPDEAHASAASAMTMRMAVRTSSNRAAVRMLSEVGLDQTVGYVKRLGFEAPPVVPSLALGTGNVSVLSLTAAYAAFANGGRVAAPVAIRRVENRAGEVLFQDSATPQPAISQTTAFLMAQMLADVIDAGTGYRVRQAGFRLPAGGKTGTTDDYHDAWFAGFTPALAATVWVGFDQPQQIVPGGYAGDLAAPIWGSFMRDATQNRGSAWLAQPADVVSIKICKLSGQLPGPGCPVVTEYFKRGTEPTQICVLHANLDDRPLDANGVPLRDNDLMGDVTGRPGDNSPSPIVTPPLPSTTLPPPPRAVQPFEPLTLPGRSTLPPQGGGGDGRGRGDGGGRGGVP